MALSKNHYVHLENGKFSGSSLSDLQKAFSENKAAPAANGLVLHFHGGLVSSAAAIEAAEKLLPAYQSAQAYPLFFVWETGSWETVRNNLSDLSNEPLFKVLLSRLVDYLQSKFGLSTSATSFASEGLAGLETEIERVEVVKEVEFPRAAIGAVTISEAELQDMFAGDSELKSAYEDLRARVNSVDHDAVNESVNRETGARGILPDESARQDLFGNASAPTMSEGFPMAWFLPVVAVAARVGKRVLGRLLTGRDHGWYTTTVEELLRELYADQIGSSLFWNQMKKDAADAFGPDVSRFGGSAFLAELKAMLDSGVPAPRITLIGQDAGAIFASRFLLAAHAVLPTNFQFDLVLLAPAVDCELFSSVIDTGRIRNIRSFGMSDSLESEDAVLGPVSGWLRGVYPRSWLYFISGLLESAVDLPLVGMQRYYDISRYPTKDFPALNKVRDYLGQASDRQVWSIDDDGAGRKSSAKHHSEFNFDRDTLESVKHIISRGFASTPDVSRHVLESALSSFSQADLMQLAAELPGISHKVISDLEFSLESVAAVRSTLNKLLTGTITLDNLLKSAEQLPDGYRQLLLSAHRLKPEARVFQHLHMQMNKVDVVLQRALSATSATRSLVGAALESVDVSGSEPEVPVLIGLSDANQDLSDVAGLQVVSQVGRIVAAKATQSSIDQLSRDARVVSVELSRDNAYSDCVNSIPFIGVINSTTRQRLAEQGDQCLIAVIDADIDVLHAAFREPDQTDSSGQIVRGKTRIHAVWDQTDSTGPAPAGFQNLGGTLHMGSDIDGYIATGVVGKQLRRVNNGHGTHVASIAAGSPISQSNFPGGVAPQSRLIVVIANTGQFEEGSPNSLGYSLYHNAALSFIDQVATDLKLPVVVNLSQGMNAGAHDGSSLVEAMFDDFCQNGRRTGRVIVKSAGNDRSSAGHSLVTINSNALETLEWESPSSQRASDTIDIWFDSVNELTFRLLSPGGDQSERINGKEKKKAGVFTSGNTYDLRYERFCIDNGSSRLQVEIGRGTASMIEPGTSSRPWTLEISSGALVTPASIDAWIDRTSVTLPKFINHLSEDRTLSVPGTALSVIAVGAVGSQFPLRVGKFSAYGRTRDGREKPEVSAPGIDIQAAASNTAAGLRPSTGTSMAAPHVAGAIALVMSACKKNPALVVPNAKQFVSAFKRLETGQWDRGTGFGCLNTLKLLELLAGQTESAPPTGIV